MSEEIRKWRVEAEKGNSEAQFRLGGAYLKLWDASEVERRVRDAEYWSAEKERDAEEEELNAIMAEMDAEEAIED